MKLIISFIYLMVISSLSYSQDFHPGPYGDEYYDIAGPFSITDLNSSLSGDLNGDEVIDILDVVQIINIILEYINPSIEIYCNANVNQDGFINILDVVLLINIILS